MTMISPRMLYNTQKTLEVVIDDLIVAHFPSASALGDNAGAVAELLYDSIEAYSVKTGIRTSRFGEAYSASVRITIATLDKSHLRGVCRFENLPITAALRWLKSRLLSNLKTVLVNPKSNEWLGHYDREAALESVIFGDAEVEAELAGVGAAEIRAGLKKLFLEGADMGELEYLSEKFKINLSEVIGGFSIPVIVERTPQGSPQLAFDF